MENEAEIQQEIEEFLERTCITKYIFKKFTDSELFKLPKKTPVGTYTIKSVDLIYFIDNADNVIIGIINAEKDETYKAVAQFLTENAEKVE